MWTLEEISVATAIRNRLYYLREAIKTWVVHPFAEIVIVDWGSTAPLRYSDFPDDPRIKIYRIEQDEFIAPQAMGAAVRLTTSRMVFKIDSDVKLVGGIPTQPPQEGWFWRGKQHIPENEDSYHVYGTYLIPRAWYDAANGYNERLRGWGFEDQDLYTRIKKAGYPYTHFHPSVLEHIPHSPSIRLKRKADYCVKILKEQPWTSQDTPFDLTQLRLVPR